MVVRWADPSTVSRSGLRRGPGASWIRTHGLEVGLALPLVAYLLALTAAPILETLRLSFSSPLDGGSPRWAAIARCWTRTCSARPSGTR